MGIQTVQAPARGCEFLPGYLKVRRSPALVYLTAPTHLLGIAAVTTAALAAQLVGQSAAEWLRYDREAILHGQLWRLLTGHLVHLGWAHLILNVGGLLLLRVGFGGVGKSLLRELLCLVCLALGVSLGLLLGNPDLLWYVGLSGVLHGLAVLIAVQMWRRSERAGLVLLLGLVVKVGWEQAFGGASLTGVDIGGAVIFDAHLYGVISAGIILLTGYVFRRFSAARTPA